MNEHEDEDSFSGTCPTCGQRYLGPPGKTRLVLESAETGGETFLVFDGPTEVGIMKQFLLYMGSKPKE